MVGVASTDGVNPATNGGGHYYLAICEDNTDASGSVVYTAYSSCDTTLTSSDHFGVYGTPYADTIGILRSADYSSIQCGGLGSSSYILPFESYSFNLGMHFEGNAGGDSIFGSDNGDLLYSRNSGIGGDISSDSVCGKGGNDSLYGDADNTIGGPEECLDGGPGTDYCDDGDGDSTADKANSCESHTSGFRLLTTNCSCGGTAFWKGDGAS